MLRETNPAVLRKIIPIEVDYNAYDLNIDPQTLDRLHGEVQVNTYIAEKSCIQTHFITNFYDNLDSL